MDRLSDLDHQGLSQLGFKSEPGNTESLSWAGQGHESLVVDVVPAKNSVAGRGFEHRQMHGGVNVIALQALVDNLTYRVRSEPANQQARSDLARGLDRPGAGVDGDQTEKRASSQRLSAANT